MDYLAYLLTGAATGLLAGLLGVGGGIVAVPALNYLFQQQYFPANLVMHMAIGTSFAIMIFTTMAAAYAFQRKKLIIWPLFYKFLPGLILGTGVASFLSRYVSSNNLRIAFAVFLFLMALYMFLPMKIKAQRPLPSFHILILVSLFIGILSGFFGIGGGSMIVPFLVYSQIEMHKATATSVVCALPLAIVGTVGMSLSGWSLVASSQVPAGSLGYIYWPAALIVALTSLAAAPLGAYLATKISGTHLKRAFSILLMGIALNLFFH